MESGLGNQMLSYCDLLALQGDRGSIYIENMIYEIPQCHQYFCQWNGYELERIFGIKIPNISELYDEKEWLEILDEVQKTEFWLKHWNYAVHITNVLRNHGLNLNNLRGDLEKKETSDWKKLWHKFTILQKFTKTGIYYNLKRYFTRIYGEDTCRGDLKTLFSDEDNIYTGQQMEFLYRNRNIEKIENDIRKAFVFPEYQCDKNIEASNYIKQCNSIAIHARRGDFLCRSGRYYQGGFFKRAVKHMKKNVENPEFFFFCDPSSVEWCRENEKIFALNFAKDKVHFIDWNDGENSFRDMQLMSECKHNIITTSSFGWWGAFLNMNDNKITISPNVELNTTYHC